MKQLDAIFISYGIKRTSENVFQKETVEKIINASGIKAIQKNSHIEKKEEIYQLLLKGLFNNWIKIEIVDFKLFSLKTNMPKKYEVFFSREDMGRVYFSYNSKAESFESDEYTFPRPIVKKNHNKEHFKKFLKEIDEQYKLESIFQDDMMQMIASIHRTEELFIEFKNEMRKMDLRKLVGEVVELFNEHLSDRKEIKC